MKTNELTKPTREKTSVAIQGLDTSSPNDIAKDGTCEKLHNIRFKDSAWRPVHKHKEKPLTLRESTAVGSRTIVYKHPITDDNHYIVEFIPKSVGTTSYTYSDVDITNGTEVTIATFSEPQRVSHFGNVLMFISPSGITYFLHKKGAYIKHTLSTCPKVAFTDSEYTDYEALPNYFKMTGYVGGFCENQGLYADTWYRFDRFGEALEAIRNWNTAGMVELAFPTFTCLWLLSDADKLETLIPTTPESSGGERSGTSWHGEIALFAAYHTSDGKVQLPSALSIYVTDNELPLYPFTQRAFFSHAKSESTPHDDPERKYIGCELTFEYSADLSVAQIREKCPYSYKLPSIDIDIDARLNTSIISSVAIYATRINPVFNPALYVTSGNTIQPHMLWSNNKLPEQPFYLVKEFYLNADEEGDYVTRYTFELDSLVLQQSQSNRVYKPSVETSMVGDVLFDYNNALHFANIRSSFREDGVLSDALTNDGATVSTPYIRLTIDDKYYFVKGTRTSSSGIFNAPYNRIISYHDYRASAFIIDWEDGSMHPYFPLTPAVGNNIAYYIAPSNDYFKYPSFTASGIDGRYKDNSFPDVSDTISEPNRIQVSAPNNCFSFPFENSYAVGSSNNRILALQSAAIEMHEMKVGELPLYAFTEEGIFALQAGSSTIYASVVPINYDKIINPNTLAINGAIVYITEKGVHLLTSQDTQVISTPIHSADGMPPLDFLRTCKIIHPKQYNEIVLLNEDSAEGIAYVFNLDAAYWSTRDLKGRKLNTDELYYGNTIYDLADEDESKALPVEITTRPIKLGNVEFKRLETIIPRMSTNDKMVVLDMDVDGSVDGHSYSELRKVVGMELEPHRTNPIILRRTPFSAKYFKCHMLMEPELGETFNPSITHIDLEWYLRFVRRMR